MNEPDNDMKTEYDFSHAERGKHYAGLGARFQVPIYLNEQLQSHLLIVAERKNISLSDLVNDLLNKDLAIAEAMK
jgi:hypothetical protein